MAPSRNQNLRRRHKAASRKPLLEFLEDRRLLAMSDGFQPLAGVASELEATGELAKPLPLIQEPIGENLGFSQLLMRLNDEITALGSTFQTDPYAFLNAETLESTLRGDLKSLDISAQQVGGIYSVQIDGSKSIESTYSLGDMARGEGLAFNTTDAATWATGFSFDFQFGTDDGTASGNFFLRDPQLTITTAFDATVRVVAQELPNANLSEANLTFAVRLESPGVDAKRIELTVDASQLQDTSAIVVAASLNAALMEAGEDSIEFFDSGSTLALRATTAEWTKVTVFDAERLGFDAGGQSDRGDVGSGFDIGLLPVSIANGAAAFDAKIDVHFQNVTGDSDFNIVELQDPELLRLDASGTTSATLPISPIASVPAIADATVVQSETSVFGDDAQQYQITSFDTSHLSTLPNLISDGLDGLTDFVANFENHSVFTTEIPLINTTLAEQIDLDGILRERVTEPIKEFLAQNPNASASDLLTEITTLMSGFSPTNVPELNSNRDRVEYQLDFSEMFQKSLDVDFGLNGADLPLSLEAGLALTLDATADIDLMFGVELSKLPSLDEAFYFRIEDIDVSARLLTPVDGEPAASLTGRLGFASVTASVGPSTIGVPILSIAADLDPKLAMNDVTLGELRDLPLGDIIGLDDGPLFKVTPIGSVGVELTVGAQIGDFDTGSIGTPTITIVSSDLFSASELTLTHNLGNLLSFKNVSAVGFLGALETITTYLEEMRQSPVFSAEIPLTGGKTVGDLVDFSSAFSDALLANARRSDAVDLAVFADDPLLPLGTGSFDIIVDGLAVSVGIDLSGQDNRERANAIESEINAALVTAADMADPKIVPAPTVSVTYFEAEVPAADESQTPQVVRSIRFQSNANGEAGSVDALQPSNDDPTISRYFNFDTVERVPGQPRFSTIQEFQELIAETAADTIDGVRVVPAKDGRPPELVLDIDLDHDFTVATTDLMVDFGIGDLVGFDANAEVALSANLGAKLSLGIELKVPGADFILEPSTLLVDLNGGDGVLLNSDERPDNTTGDGLDDVQVTLHDGSTFAINFDGSTTVGDVLSRFNNVVGNNGKFTVSIHQPSEDEPGQAFKLTDHTADGVDQPTPVSVTTINGSLTGFGLGLLGTADTETPSVIIGIVLHGQSVADQVFLSDFYFNPSITLSADGVTANADLGFVEIAIEGDDDPNTNDLSGTLGATFTLGDGQDGLAGGKLTIAQMMELLPQVQTRLKAAGPVPEGGVLESQGTFDQFETFQVQVGTTAPISITIPKALTLDNQSAGDLASDINMALLIKSKVAEFVQSKIDSGDITTLTENAIQNGVGTLVTGILDRLIEQKIKGSIEKFLVRQATELAFDKTPEEITAEAGMKAGEIATQMTGQFLSELVTGAAASAFVNPGMVTVLEKDTDGVTVEVKVATHKLLKFGAAGDRLTVYLKDGVARPVTVNSDAVAVDPNDPDTIPTSELGWARTQNAYVARPAIYGDAQFNLSASADFVGLNVNLPDFGIDLSLPTPTLPNFLTDLSLPTIDLDLGIDFPGIDVTGLLDLPDLEGLLPEFGLAGLNPFAFELPDLPFELGAFDGVSFDTILAGLRKVQDFLGGLDLGILNTDLPLIDINLSELFDFALDFGDFINDTASTPAGSLQVVEELIEDLLQLPDGEGADGNPIPIFGLPQLNELFGRPELNRVPDSANPGQFLDDPTFFEQVAHLKTLQHDNDEVTISMDRAKVVRHVGDYVDPETLDLGLLTKFIEKSKATLIGSTIEELENLAYEAIRNIELELPGVALRLDLAYGILASESFGRGFDADPAVPGIQVPINLDLQQFLSGLGVDLPDLIDLRGQSLLTLEASAELGISLGMDLTHPDGPLSGFFLYDYEDFKQAAQVVTDVNDWKGISEGKIGIQIDGELFDIAGLNFAWASDMDDVATELQTKINATSTSTDISVVFEASRLIFTSGLAADDDRAGIKLQTATETVSGTELIGNEAGLIRPLRHGTGLELSASAGGTDISFDAAVGAFGVFIREGTADLDGSFELFLERDSDAAEDNRHYFRDPTVVEDLNGNRENEVFGETVSFGELIGTEVSATATANLPTAFPVESSVIGDFDVLIDIPEFINYLGDTDAYTVTEIPANSGTPGIEVRSNQGGLPAAVFTYPVFESFDLGDNLFAMVGGWNGIFDLAIDAMKGEVLGFPIPLIGDKLADEARFLEEIRDSVLANFDQLAGTGSSDDNPFGLDAVQRVMFEALGPGGVNLLRDANGDAQITQDDVTLTTVSDGAGGLNGIRFDIHLGRDFALLDTEVDFDLGLPGLGLEVDGGVILNAGFDFVFGVGIDFENGVYFDTSDDSELEVFVEAMIPGLSAAGELGFLRLDVDELPKAIATTSPLRGPENAKQKNRNAAIRVHAIPDGESETIKDGDGTIEVPLSDVAIEFVHQAGIGSDPTVAFDPTAAKLTFTIENGVTTANQVIFALNTSDVEVGDLPLRKLFRATTGPHGDGTGSVHQDDSATTQLSGTRVRADFMIDLLDPSNFGEDGAPGKEGVDDDNDGKIDELDEQGFPGSDDPTDPDVLHKLTISELYGSDFDQLLGASLEVDADIDLLLTASFGGDASLPRVRSDFSLDWDFRKSFGVLAPVEGEDQSIEIPTIRFDTIQLNIGEFIAGFVGDSLAKIDEVIEPFRPVLEVLQAPIPVISELAGDDITLLDLAKLLGVGKAVEFIEAVATLDDLITTVNAFSGEGDGSWLTLGSFDLNGGAAMDPGMAGKLSPMNEEQADDVESQLGDSGASDFNDKTLMKPKAERKFFFPIIENPASAFQFFLGNDIDLFLFDAPALEVEFTMKKFYPAPAPFSIVGLTVEGSLSAKADFAFGYDTVGINQFLKSNNFLDIFNGFFVSDTENPNGTGADVPEIEFRATIEVTPDTIPIPPFPVPISPRVTGGLTAGIDLNLHDIPDPFTGEVDGKIRVSEIIHNAQLGGAGIHIFDISGFFEAGLTLSVIFGIEPFAYTEEFELANIRLLDFEIPRPSENLVELASVQNGVLLLNMGDRAGCREADSPQVICGTNVDDVAEHFTLLPGATSDRVVVQGFGQTIGYTGVTSIVADGGIGNDYLFVHPDIDQPVTFDGGQGDDTFFGGGGSVTVSGGLGNDWISGSPQNDRIDGGDGDNRIFAFAGDDHVLGGIGRDIIDAGSGNDTVLSGGGPDDVRAGDGDDSVMAGNGNDVIDGGRGNDNLFGDGGDDKIDGRDGDDLLVGGTGNDRINGAAGLDRIFGGEGNDQITGGVGNDHIEGGGGGDTIDAGLSNDTVYGDYSNLTGFAPFSFFISVAGEPSTDGDDVIMGGPGSDNLFGGGGNDLIYATDAATGTVVNGVLLGDRDGVHQIEGGLGDDTLFGELGADVIIAGPVLIPRNGQTGVALASDNDTVFAFDGDDVIRGGDGNDTITAGTGTDQIVGGWGADLILAGDTRTPIDDGPQLIVGDEENGDAAIPPGTLPTDHNDEIFAGNGSERIIAGPGNDTVHAFSGDDDVEANAGNDLVYAGAGDDQVSGGLGDDELFGADGNDLIWGGIASFSRAAMTAFELPPGVTEAEANRLLITGTATTYTTPNDIVPVIVGGDSQSGLAGDGLDKIRGGDGQDWLFGGGDADDLDGESGRDYVDGGAGNDDVRGGADEDVVRGGANDDDVHGGSGIDQVYGDAGRDHLYGDGGDAANNQLGQRLFGGEGIDFLYAYAPTTNTNDPASELGQLGDELIGGPGGDFLYGNLRKELFQGGDGNDFVGGDWLAGPLYQPNPMASTSGAADWAFGGSGEDQLLGGGGQDLLIGGGDTDWLEGQDGNDTLLGGQGIDVLVLDVRANYTEVGDNLDGHGDETNPLIGLEDNATDILLIEGTSADDTITLKQGANANTLLVDYSGREINGIWRDDNKLFVEQFRVSGLLGNDTLEFDPSLDLSALAGRSNDWVGVLDGGPGNDTLRGSVVRDRLDGGSGSDSVFGFAGDDQLRGGPGNDTLFAGQGNDDLIGGDGDNKLYAWTREPGVPYNNDTGTPAEADFGIWVQTDANGNKTLVDGNTGALPLEDTGLNRILGGRGNDQLFGGTGLDFLYGNGGNDTLYRADGSTFESIGESLAGEAWKEYAKDTNKVWYIGATNADDVISVDFVTEPGLLTDHHLITRLTNNNGNFSFAAQVRLDFSATDENDDPIWNPLEILDLDVLFTDDVEKRSAALGNLSNRIEKNIADLIPSEGDFLAILIDALGGNDQITVGPTVQKTVWIDAGDGDDRVEILAGNAILTDKTEFGKRNDRETEAFALPGAAVVAAAGPAPANGILAGANPANFTIVIEQTTGRIEANLALLPQQTNGKNGTPSNFSADDPVLALIEDINGLLTAEGIGSLVTAYKGANGGISFATSDVAPGQATLQLIVDPQDPAATSLGLISGTSTVGNVIVANTTYSGLTIDNPDDVDWYEFRLAAVPDSAAAIRIDSGSPIDGLGLAIYPLADDVTDSANQLNASSFTTTGQTSRVSLAGLAIDQTYLLRVDSPNIVPTIYDLTFDLALAGDPLVVSLGQRTDVVRRDVILGGTGRDILSGGPAEDWIFGGPGNDVLTGGRDRQAPDLLFGGDGDDTFQLIADQLPLLTDSDKTFVPTFVDEFDGGDGDDRVLFLGGDFDRLGQEVPDYASLRYNRFLHRYEFTNLVWDIENQAFLSEQDPAPTTLIAENDMTSADLGGDAQFEITVGSLSETITLPHRSANGFETGDNQPFDFDALVDDLNAAIEQANEDRATQEPALPPLNVVANRDGLRIALTATEAGAQERVTITFEASLFNARLGFTDGQTYQATETPLVQEYLFYTTKEVERTVIDLQAGDDVFRGDPEFKFPGIESEWGIDPGDFQQRALIAALEVRGSDGNDALFGGALGDLLIGGPGIDWINGGEGDDEISGGPGADFLAGNSIELSDIPTTSSAHSAFTFAQNPTGLTRQSNSSVYQFQLAAPLFALSQSTDRAGAVLPTPTELGGVQNTLETDVFLSDAFVLTGDQLSQFQPVGDFNGDGFADFLAQGTLRSYLLLGPIDLTSVHDIEDQANIIIDHAALGLPADRTGNVNGDAFGDLTFVKQEIGSTIVTIILGGTHGGISGTTPIDWPRNWDGDFATNFLDGNNSRRISLNQGQLPAFQSGDVTASLLNFDGDRSIDGKSFDDLLIAATSQERGLRGAFHSYDSVPGILDGIPILGGEHLYKLVAPDQLYRLDGDTATKIQTPGGTLYDFDSIGDTLIFAAEGSSQAKGIWKLEPFSEQATKLTTLTGFNLTNSLNSLFPNDQSTTWTILEAPERLVAVDNQLLFIVRVTNGDSGFNPYVFARLPIRTNGTAGTPKALIDLGDSLGKLELSDSGESVLVTGERSETTVFWQYTPGVGTDQYVSARIQTPNFVSSLFQNSASLDGSVYLALDEGQANGDVGTELYRLSPGDPQPVLVRDIFNVEQFGSTPRELTVVDGRLYFTAVVGLEGRTLWRFDPQTDELENMQAIVAPQDLTAFEGDLFYQKDGSLWRFDGNHATVVADNTVSILGGDQSLFVHREFTSGQFWRYTPDVIGYVISGDAITGGLSTQLDGSSNLEGASHPILAGTGSDEPIQVRRSFQVIGDPNGDGLESIAIADPGLSVALQQASVASDSDIDLAFLLSGPFTTELVVTLNGVPTSIALDNLEVNELDDLIDAINAEINVSPALLGRVTVEADGQRLRFNTVTAGVDLAFDIEDWDPSGTNPLGLTVELPAVAVATEAIDLQSLIDNPGQRAFELTVDTPTGQVRSNLIVAGPYTAFDTVIVRINEAIANSAVLAGLLTVELEGNKLRFVTTDRGAEASIRLRTGPGSESYGITSEVNGVGIDLGRHKQLATNAFQAVGFQGIVRGSALSFVSPQVTELGRTTIENRYGVMEQESVFPLADLNRDGSDAFSIGLNRFAIGNVSFTSAITPLTIGVSDYERAVSDDGAIAFWSFGETAGAEASSVQIDGTSVGPNAVYVGAPTLGAPGPFGGRSVELNASDTNDSIQLDPLDLQGESFSIEFWIKTTQSGADGAILSYAIDNEERELLIEDASDLNVWISGNRVKTGVAVNDGQWHHVAIVQHGVERLRLYKNGIPVFETTAGKPIEPGGVLVFGQQQERPGGPFRSGAEFQGQLSHVAIYNQTLSREQIVHHLAQYATIPSVGNEIDMMSGDFNGDNVLDLAVSESVTDAEGNLKHQVGLFWSIGDVTGDQTLANANVLFDSFDSHVSFSSDTAIDVNGDRYDDLILIGSDAKAFVIYGAADRIQLPTAPTDLVNRTVSGSGSYLVDQGNGRLELGTLLTGLQWFQFSTLGDGQRGDAIVLREEDDQIGLIQGTLFNPSGRQMRPTGAVVDLAGLPAGKYFLQIEPLSEASYRIEVQAPIAGFSRAASDRDLLLGGDGEDTIFGNGDLDRIFGQSGNEVYCAEPVELRDFDPLRDSLITPCADEHSSIQPEAVDPLVFAADSIFTDGAIAVSIARALGVPVTTSHTGAPIIHEPIYASDIASLHQLVITNEVVSTLDGLQHAVNLERLELTLDPAVDISVLGRLPRLRTLVINAPSAPPVPLAGAAQSPSGATFPFASAPLSFASAPSELDEGSVLQLAGGTLLPLADDGMQVITDVGVTKTFLVRNVAPTIETAFSELTISEGASINVSGSFTDPGADTWTITVDYGDNTAIESISFDDQAKTFSLAHAFADEGSFQVTVTIRDDDGGQSTSSFVVNTIGVAPTATLANTPVFEGTPFTVRMINQDDPSSVDLEAGFTYRYQYSFDGVNFTPLETDVEFSQIEFPANLLPDDDLQVTLRATIIDKNQRSTTYTSPPIDVQNVAPIGILNTPDAVAEGSSARVFFSDVFDPSPTDTRQGFLYSFDFNGDGDFSDLGELSQSIRPFADVPATLLTGVAALAISGKVEDRDGGSTTYAITIQVNQTPAAIHLDQTTVSENVVTTDPVLIGTLSASDDTAVDQLVYSLVDGFGDNALFEIFPETIVTTGASPQEQIHYRLRLRSGAFIDFETKSAYQVRVAVDDGGNGLEQDFTITVLDLNEHPTNILLSKTAVVENIALNVGSLAVTDPDNGDTHTFSVDPLSGFEIVNGVLRLKSPADHESSPSLSVAVTATDVAGLSLVKTFIISITDLNESPTDLTISSLTVAEATPGAVIGAVTVEDPDQGDAHSFAVDDMRFVIVGGRLRLAPGTTLDHEASAGPINVTITATDSGNNHITRSFAIVVTDINEAPQLSLPAAPSVAAGVNAAVVGTITATDPEGDATSLQLSDIRFEVVGDQLKLKSGQSLDANGPNTVTVNVTASDNATPPLRTTKTLTITVDKSAFFDFGDAPTPYPTLLANDGARHTPGSLRLGQLLDIEVDGQPRTITNENNVTVVFDDDHSVFDDEDGIRFTTKLFTGPVATSASLVATVSGAVTGSGRLDAWIDFNQNGNWEPGEHIFSSRTVSNGANVMEFTVPAGIPTGETHARFRISSDGNLSPTGLAADGEVEDHPITIVEAPVVWSIETSNLQVEESGSVTHSVSIQGQMTADETTVVGLALVHGTTTESDLVDTTPNSAPAFVDAINAAITAYVGPGEFFFANQQLMYRAITEGMQMATLSVVLGIADDDNAETTERFTVRLSNPTRASGPVALAANPTVTSEILPNDNAPRFTTPSLVSVAENSFDVQALAAEDIDRPAQAITFAIGGSGADNDKFEIRNGTELRFINAPDFEMPTDAGGVAGNNVYEVTVQATDGTGLVTTQRIRVTVTSTAIPPRPESWQNDRNRFDVNDSGTVSPIDALLVINYMARNGVGVLPTLLPGERPAVYVDVSGDNQVTPLDALQVINQLAILEQLGGGEGESDSSPIVPYREETSRSVGSASQVRDEVFENNKLGVALTASTNERFDEEILEAAGTDAVQHKLRSRDVNLENVMDVISADIAEYWYQED